MQGSPMDDPPRRPLREAEESVFDDEGTRIDAKLRALAAINVALKDLSPYERVTVIRAVAILLEVKT